MGQDEIKEIIRKELTSQLENAKVVIRVPDNILLQILQDGKFKSQFETQSSGGLLDPLIRARTEKQLFSYSEDLLPDKRPIYGTLTNDINTTAAKQYGKAQVILKDEVKNKATYTGADSLDRRGIYYLHH